jgi:hypothetical protein
MKNTFAKIILAASLIVTPFALAHEGHDEPVSVQAPKGGVIKGIEDAYIEVVVKGKDVKIYFYDKDLKPQDVSTFKVSAVAELPRGKKAEPVTLKAQGTSFEASFDAKGAHRYSLVLTVVDAKHGHDDKLTFTVEPKR